MSKKTIISADNIYKSYPIGKSSRLEVLKGIDIKINQGEIVAITGPSGVGKSTLLHIIGTLDKPDKGELIFNSSNVFSMNDQELAKFRNVNVGFIFQFHYLMPEFSALENVAMPGLISGINEKKVFEKAEELLNEVGLADRLLHKPNELSGGENQRVAFARALQNDPLLILADEPSGNLDQSNSDFLHEMMWNLVHSRDKTFVVVTHDNILASNSDRVIELYDGKVK